MIAYVWIGVWFGTWWHVWTAAMIAPLMLLRTEGAVECGWRIKNQLNLSIGTKMTRQGRGLLGLTIYISTVGLASIAEDFVAGYAIVAVGASLTFLAMAACMPAVLGRFAGAAMGFFDAPLLSIAAIPQNWWQLVACIDFRQSPELIPHPRSVEPASGRHRAFVGDESAIALYHAWGVVASLREDLRAGESRLRVVTLAVFTPLMVLPALLFRLSIKSTALIWLPLLWAAKPPKPEGEPWGPHIKLKAKDDLTLLVVLFSLISLSFVAAKILLFVAEHKLAMTAQAWHACLGERLGEFAVAFVRPGEIPIWQIASTLNAILAISLFLLLRHWLRRTEVGLENNELTIERTLAGFYLTRRLLSTYTIGNHLVVFYLLARELPLPTVGSSFFSWL